jgi:hypothetical protein
MEITEIYFLPPLAIARLGASDTPLDCFVWDTDKSIHGANRTVIQPAVTLRVMADGSLRPFVPNAIQFRDGAPLRPVAPFFELWATINSGAGSEDKPLTTSLLRRFGANLSSVEYTITVANRKAQRRTGSAACAYIARQSVQGNDHERKPLLAYSPHSARTEPLVTRDRPIPLGHFQVIRPIKRKAMNVDLSALRVRFTPAKGKVYGPRTAIAGPASPLPPGQALDPLTLGGRLYEIVPEDNRILNPHTKWSEYIMDADKQEDPQPSDSYDGANVGNNRSWGVVDDSCDGIIEAQVAIRGARFVATARVLSSCPDFAPDRRPLNSFADDLADRDLESVQINPQDRSQIAQTQAEIADLFARAFETASLINLDSNRYRALSENATNRRDRPQVNFDSMTGKDKPPADLTADLFPSAPDPNDSDLPYSDVAHFRHGELSDIEIMLDLFSQNATRVRKIIRPPFGRFRQLKKRPHPRSKPSADFRDPRVARDQLHDMRMPPYMRDSDLLPLSITQRQYDALVKLLSLSAVGKGQIRREGPTIERIREILERRAQLPENKRQGRGEGEWQSDADRKQRAQRNRAKPPGRAARKPQGRSRR